MCIRDSANGEVISLQGKKAIEYKKSIRSKYDGEVTGEKLKSALTAYQKVIKENGNITEDNEKFPLTVYTESISPIKPLLSKMPEVFADPQTGVGLSLIHISFGRGIHDKEECLYLAAE